MVPGAASCSDLLAAVLRRVDCKATDDRSHALVASLARLRDPTTLLVNNRDVSLLLLFALAALGLLITRLVLAARL